MSPPPGAAALSDVQAEEARRRLPIDEVGVRGLRLPLRVRDRSGVQHTVAELALYVDLEARRRGTHMSRLLEILNDEALVLSVAGLPALLQRVRQRLQAGRAVLEARFPFFVLKRAPVSGAPSRLDHEVRLRAEGAAGRAGRPAGGLAGCRVEVSVTVPVTSLCPCSKAISAYGAHNQRSHLRATVRLGGPLWLEELIEALEAEASAPVYGLVKRGDEKHLTERAYENPKFVEDAARDLAARLAEDPRVEAFRVEVENFESIHNHSAYACIRGGAWAGPARDARGGDARGGDVRRDGDGGKER
ncbi:MAG: GTP cyclohydrolase I FolE2, partial [Gammaproteobacteria bacterium]